MQDEAGRFGDPTQNNEALRRDGAALRFALEQGDTEAALMVVKGNPNLAESLGDPKNIAFIVSKLVDAQNRNLRKPGGEIAGLHDQISDLQGQLEKLAGHGPSPETTAADVPEWMPRVQALIAPLLLEGDGDFVVSPGRIDFPEGAQLEQLPNDEYAVVEIIETDDPVKSQTVARTIRPGKSVMVGVQEILAEPASIAVFGLNEGKLREMLRLAAEKAPSYFNLYRQIHTIMEDIQRIPPTDPHESVEYFQRPVDLTFEDAQGEVQHLAGPLYEVISGVYNEYWKINTSADDEFMQSDDGQWIRDFTFREKEKFSNQNSARGCHEQYTLEKYRSEEDCARNGISITGFVPTEDIEEHGIIEQIETGIKISQLEGEGDNEKQVDRLLKPAIGKLHYWNGREGNPSLPLRLIGESTQDIWRTGGSYHMRVIVFADGISPEESYQWVEGFSYKNDETLLAVSPENTKDNFWKNDHLSIVENPGRGDRQLSIDVSTHIDPTKHFDPILGIRNSRGQIIKIPLQPIIDKRYPPATTSSKAVVGSAPPTPPGHNDPGREADKNIEQMNEAQLRAEWERLNGLLEQEASQHPDSAELRNEAELSNNLYNNATGWFQEIIHMFRDKPRACELETYWRELDDFMFNHFQFTLFSRGAMLGTVVTRMQEVLKGKLEDAGFKRIDGPGDVELARVVERDRDIDNGRGIPTTDPRLVGHIARIAPGSGGWRRITHGPDGEIIDGDVVRMTRAVLYEAE